jgi:PfaD family protein
MAPAGDMFEMGVKVQVLKRGTMFPMRATKLSEIYNSCESIEAIPPAEKAMLEKTVFHASLEEIWEQTKRYFEERDNTKILMAEKNPKYKMALIFRWYLGQSSHWATAGKPERRLDYQIWCGPAMGAFNEWARGSFLEKPASRKVVTVALNLLHGAAVMKRLDAMKCQGLDIETELNPVPIEESELKNNLI